MLRRSFGSRWRSVFSLFYCFPLLFLSFFIFLSFLTKLLVHSRPLSLEPLHELVFRCTIVLMKKYIMCLQELSMAHQKTALPRLPQSKLPPRVFPKPRRNSPSLSAFDPVSSASRVS